MISIVAIQDLDNTVTMKMDGVECFEKTREQNGVNITS